MKVLSFIKLMRPANIMTAIADIVAGISIAGVLSRTAWDERVVLDIILLVIATGGLYGGGIVFNDVFDLDQDKIMRPERVIPSGKVSVKEAVIFGIILFLIGIGAACMVSPQSGFLATGIALFALSYDKFAKHHNFLGPVNMGLCRGLNLILGMSIVPDLVAKFWPIGVLPIIFIAAVTLTAQKETQGKNKKSIIIAVLLDTTIIIGFILMERFFDLSLKNALAFMMLWYFSNVIFKLRAIMNNNPASIQKAVKIGVLSLIVLDAGYVAGFSSVYWGFLVMALLPVSLYLSKKFPVT